MYSTCELRDVLGVAYCSSFGHIMIILPECSGSASVTSSFFIHGERDVTVSTQEVARGTTLTRRGTATLPMAQIKVWPVCKLSTSHRNMFRVNVAAHLSSLKSTGKLSPHLPHSLFKLRARLQVCAPIFL